MDPLNPREPYIPEELECAMEVIRAKVPLPYLETMQDYMSHIRADDTKRIAQLEAALRTISKLTDATCDEAPEMARQALAGDR